MSNDISKKIEKILKTLKDGVYERDNEINLIMLAMLSGKSIFLYGEPGTAKSMIARRVSHAFKDSSFFSYLMQKFSTPEEIFGPYSIKELREDKLVRKTENYLPEADFAFLDEIWKSSPAILNTLLTIINEKIFRNGDEDVQVPLKGLVTASNEFPPQNQGLEALYDRMIFRCSVKYVKDRNNFQRLIIEKPVNDIIISDPITKDDLDTIAKELYNVKVGENIFDIIHAVRVKIDKYNEEQEDFYISVSDRRWQKIMEVIRISAYISGRNEVIPSDLLLLKHSLWDDLDEIDVVNDIIDESIRQFAPKKTQEYQKCKKEFDELADEIKETYQEQEDEYEDISEYNGNEYFDIDIEAGDDENVNLMIPTTILHSKKSVKAFIWHNDKLVDKKEYEKNWCKNHFTYECVYNNGKIEIKEVDSGYNKDRYNSYGHRVLTPYIVEKISSKGTYKPVGKSAHKNYLEKSNVYIEKMYNIIRQNHDELEKLSRQNDNFFIDKYEIISTLSYYNDFINDVNLLKLEMEKLIEMMKNNPQVK